MDNELKISGLTSAEVEARVQAGKVNIANDTSNKTIGQIIRSNVFTYFNLIFLVITILVCISGKLKNLTFLPIILGNMLIGIVQEIRAKKVLDKMKILNAPHATVVRNGMRSRVDSTELVQDDTVYLTSGDPICADGELIEGEVIVNESMLTGEADGITKRPGDRLLSGSFVVSGEGHAVLRQVGNDSYIAKLTNDAKALKSGEESEMIKGINMFVKVIGIIIIPMSLILFAQAFWYKGESFSESIVGMVASVIGMVPEGLYLLTTIALAVSMMRLASNKVLLHDMKSIESLARVDVLCVDKTGTITKPEMKVVETVPYNNPQNIYNFQEKLQAYINASIDNNATFNALNNYVSNATEKYATKEALKVFPFNSTAKYGAITFEEGTWILGAPEFVLKGAYPDAMETINGYASKGYRVIVLALTDSVSEEGIITGGIELYGMVVLANEIRDNAVETFSYFKEQGVKIKVISGDNPVTVSEVARTAGIEGAENYIDASTLTDQLMIAEAVSKYTVFGRVTPSQKQDFVKALKLQGHTVAMTGDGVNDILALKDADCSVAMASGSEATAQASQIVLLDSDFSRMPKIVLEGRRVVNNVQRSASLFLVKNIFSLLLTIFSTVLMISYPLLPTQVSLISMFTIGIPGFLLALEPNKQRIEGKFLQNVLLKALPAGLTDFLAVSAIVICGQVFNISKEDIATSATLLISVVGFMIIIKISHPMNKIRFGILMFNLVGLAFCGIVLGSLFDMKSISDICLFLTIVFAFAAESIFRNVSKVVEFIQLKEKRKRRRNRK